MRAALLVSMLLCAGAAGAQEIPWAPLPPELPGPEGKRALEEMAASRSGYCLPTQAEIALPLFPGVQVYDMEWSKKKPQCAKKLEPGKERVFLMLVSKAPIEEVARWYDAKLGHFPKYPSADGAAVDYVGGERVDFRPSWERMSQLPHVSLYAQKDSPVAKLGYRTLIVVSEPGKP